METREWTYADKSKWGEGPWQNEPDKIQFADAHTGLPCLIVRGPMSNLCGYVGVSEGHPSYGKKHDDVDVDCHGGLTFSGFCQEHADEGHGICHIPGPGEPDNVWWLGFDAGHCYDLSPEFESKYPELRIHDMVYRDVAYMKHECRMLSEQLAGMTQ